MSEKESIVTADNETVTSAILGRAIAELWFGHDSQVVFSQRRNTTNCGKRSRGYANLKRNSVSASLNELSLEEEWNRLTSEIASAVQENGWQSKKNNDFSLSCVSVDDFSFDGQRALTEIIFTKNENDKKIDTTVKYHERTVATNDILAQMGSLDIMEKARALFRFFNKSFVCRGFIKPSVSCVELSNSYRCHRVKDLRERDSMEQERVFSVHCQVLTNAGGECCYSCKGAEKTFKKRQRRREAAGGVVKSHCNHRYMTKEEIADRLAEMKRRYLKNKAMNSTEAEMVSVEENDNSDVSEGSTGV